MASVPPVPQLPPVLAATGPFFMFSLEETFELIGEAGFDGAELMIMQDRVSQDPLRLGALAARYGVPVPAVHGPFLVATWLVFGTDPKGKLERCVRFAETAKVSTVVIHPPWWAPASQPCTTRPSTPRDTAARDSAGDVTVTSTAVPASCRADTASGSGRPKVKETTRGRRSASRDSLAG